MRPHENGQPIATTGRRRLPAGYSVMPGKSVREVIASRLREWMGVRPDLDTQQKVAAASGVSQTTMSRLLNAQTGVTIDNLEAVAQAFGRSSWELVVPSQASNLLMTLQSHKVFSLPANTQDSIAAFAKFSAEQAAGARPVLNIEHVEELRGPVKQAVKRAAIKKAKDVGGSEHRGKGRRA